MNEYDTRCKTPPWFKSGNRGFAIAYMHIDGERRVLADEGIMVVCSTREEAETYLEVMQPEISNRAVSDWMVLEIVHSGD